jgi:hypothetical protein
MKHLPRHARHAGSTRYGENDTDSQSQSLQRAFVVAHGHPHGPLSTLTDDCRVRIQPTGRRVQVA